ncbi:style cell-cycle inhibitor 1-B isoform X2 [Salvia hispanica]|uniref:style cell-cycle inhibitor 1-B isoform X2 n=1 Tax=Salvia hispanica TaxID=49212 RepID=UPI002009685F|nr:style cell-cycle inhibitor 1-B isoform X2 [Salvia hispanica]
MGKSKDDNHKLKRSSSSPRDESRSKRRRSKDDDKEHKSSKKHKSHTSSKHHSRKEQKSSGKRKHKGHKHDKLPLDIQELTDDDYFSKNNEFSTWLKEEKRKFFADLSSEAARSLFKEFVAEWNSQELEPHYYDGIATAPRTSHKWNIKK